jgi:mRNA-degrading endonuclease toxin of MazEF toxin-antitoxin module
MDIAINHGEKGKVWPCLVLVGSGHPWEIVIIVPITEPSATYRPAKLFVPIPANADTLLEKNSVVDCFQIRFLSQGRLSEFEHKDGKGKGKGRAPDAVIDDVRTRLAAILDIG